MHRIPPQCNVRVRIAALILGNAEPEDPCIEVNDDIQILRKDLKPQRHVHPRMFAHPSQAAMDATQQRRLPIGNAARSNATSCHAAMRFVSQMGTEAAS
jgi:hypothetical protein